MPPLSDPQERRCLYGHINLIQEHPLWSGCFLYIEIVLQIVCVFKYFLQFTVFCNKNNNYERYLFKETLTDFNTSNKNIDLTGRTGHEKICQFLLQRMCILCREFI